MIGDDITVTVLDDTNNAVRVHVDAPKNVVVHWEDTHKEIQRGRERAEAVNDPC
jgi:carbon storage regulator CsrA